MRAITRPTVRWVALGIALGIYITAFAFMPELWSHFLSPLPVKDEQFFVPTISLMAEHWPPNAEILRSYTNQNTPAFFIFFSWLEHSFGIPLQGLRLINLMFGAGVILLLIADSQEKLISSIAGLLLFPYFIFTSTLLYTDIFCAFWLVLGLLAFTKERYALMFLCMVIAVSTRQYAVAFSIGVSGFALLSVFLEQDSHRNRAFLIPFFWAILSGLSFLPWYLFWGGLAPPGAPIVGDSGLFALKPGFSIYFAACIGFYFVIPELVLNRDVGALRNLTKPRNFILSLAVLSVVALFLPDGNPPGYPISTLGLLDKILSAPSLPLLRDGTIALLAIVAIVRFFENTLAAWLFWANMIVMSKSYIGWDKYALLLIATLWFLRTRRQQTPCPLV